MTIRYLKSKFRPRRSDDAGRPVHRVWIGDQEEAVLIDIAAGKVLGHIWHDGCGKFYPTVYVSPLRAIQIGRSNEGFLVSLLPLPRCIIELIRLHSMDEAQASVQYVLEGNGS
jgi:hypothetical protein